MKFAYQTSSRINATDLKGVGNKLAQYVADLQNIYSAVAYENPECFLSLLNDSSLIESVEALKKQKVSPALKYIFVVGIGGPNLGSRAIYDALKGYSDILYPQRLPKIIFFDTCDGEFLDHLKAFLIKITSADEILINIISKSGSTVETLVNADIITHLAGRRFSDINQRIVVTTDWGSKLWSWAKAQKIPMLKIPEHLGGRYSVMSSVGLFPLACAGLDIKAWLDGGRKMAQACLKSSINSNPAMISAAILYTHLKKGRLINDTFVFAPQLESLGKWYRQLNGESLGKELDIAGKPIVSVMFPTVSVGTNDLHSMGQLYLSTQQQTVTTFVTNLADDNSKVTPSDLANIGTGLAGRTPAQITAAILNGVQKVYTQKKLPFVEAAFKSINESELGQFMIFKMMETIFLAKLVNVNAFDQPNVELYKEETRKILAA